MVHDWPDQARFLTPLERELVLHRLKAEQGLAGEGAFSMTVVKSALKDWKVYCMMLMYIGAAEPLYRCAQSHVSRGACTDARPNVSGSLFSPTIIAALGRFSTPDSLLLSSPRKYPAFGDFSSIRPERSIIAYVLMFITTVGTAYLSDRFRNRGFFLMGW